MMTTYTPRAIGVTLTSAIVLALCSSGAEAAEPPGGTVRVILPSCHHAQMAPPVCTHETQAGVLDDSNSALIYTQNEMDIKLAELRAQLMQLQEQLVEANSLIEQQRQTLEALSSGLARQISNLPSAVATDEATVTILRAQLQDGFDERYEMKPSP